MSNASGGAHLRATYAENLSTSLVAGEGLMRAIAVRTIVVLVAGHAAALALAHATGYAQAPAFVRLFHLDLENNLPTLCAVLMLLVCSAMLLAVAHLSPDGWRNRLPWQVIALAFLMLALDEFLMIHEGVGQTLSTEGDFTGALTYAWVIPYGATVALGGVVFLPWLLGLNPWVRNRFILSGGLFVGGALGMEMVGGAYYSAAGDPVVHGRTLTGDLISTLEEIMELCGVALFADTLFRMLARKRLTVRLGVG